MPPLAGLPGGEREIVWSPPSLCRGATSAVASGCTLYAACGSGGHPACRRAGCPARRKNASRPGKVELFANPVETRALDPAARCRQPWQAGRPPSPRLWRTGPPLQKSRSVPAAAIDTDRRVYGAGQVERNTAMNGDEQPRPKAVSLPPGAGLPPHSKRVTNRA